MMQIASVECFSHVQRHRQTTEQGWLLVNLGRLDAMSAELPSGRQLCSLKEEQGFAMLLPSGSRLDFDYGEGRDNWVVKLRDGSVTESTSGSVVLSLERADGEFSAFHLLDSSRAERCRDYLTRMLQAFHNPESNASCLLHLAFHSLLDCILNPDLPLDQEEPAEALRKRIIADREFVKSLSALSLECGYSPDHVRRLFEARFGTTPNAFRTAYRMGIAKDLLKLHGLPVKKVSEQLGFSSPAHFSLAFKKHFGQTPGAMR